MNAFNLYEAVYDTAREEFVPESREERIQDVIDYAGGAYDPPVYVSREIAEKIVNCQIDWYTKTWGEGGDGQYENNYYYCVEEVLKDIEL